MKLPRKVCVDVEQNPSITNANKRAREWCGSVVGAIVWLSSILPNATYVFRGHADANWDLQSPRRAVKTAHPRALENRTLVGGQFKTAHLI
jgi:hypothetical protein